MGQIIEICLQRRNCICPKLCGPDTIVARFFTVNYQYDLSHSQ